MALAKHGMFRLHNRDRELDLLQAESNTPWPQNHAVNGLKGLLNGLSFVDLDTKMGASDGKGKTKTYMDERTSDGNWRLDSMLVTKPFEKNINVNPARGTHRSHQPSLLEMSHLMSDLKHIEGTKVSSHRLQKTHYSPRSNLQDAQRREEALSFNVRATKAQSTKVTNETDSAEAESSVHSDSAIEGTTLASKDSETSAAERERLARELLRKAINKLKQVELRYLNNQKKKKPKLIRREPWKMNYPLSNLDVIPEVVTPISESEAASRSRISKPEFSDINQYTELKFLADIDLVRPRGAQKLPSILPRKEKKQNRSKTLNRTKKNAVDRQEKEIKKVR
ncbi:hypothetical protein CAPTEDRAFT_186822 [Capitella teleta]|uniref:Uncharacterized protein n=1 Tax=Capitella teleta TaxID=283909 RepID=R7UC88_CAPTE|nr:hypothetical protein CAPTEDRAFT_186822 [Capitella teleta]|eukprot:ELU03970.1 hypothetical protein CAPTEDRAFT_186822 [Capitella teleta]